MDREALTVAMTLVPALYSRNKLFSLFKDPVVVRARSRARMLRSVVRHLQTAKLSDLTVHRATPSRIAYAIRAVRVSRSVEMSRAEIAAVAFVARGERIHFTEDDRRVLESVLHKLPQTIAAPSLLG